MLVLPYVLDGLADPENSEHNAIAAPGDRISDPFSAVIIAVNEWLHWYVLVYTRICMYMHVSVCLCYVSDCIRTYMYVYAGIASTVILYPMTTTWSS